MVPRPAGRLYYLPAPGENPETTEIIAPRLETLLHVQGTATAPVAHLRFENLAFQHAEWDYPPDDPGSIQAAFKVPGAIIFERAEDCALFGCEVAHVAQYAIEVRTGSSGITIAACHLHDLGGGGVRVNHEWMGRTDETARPQDTAAKPMAVTVADCTIHDASRVHLSAIGVWVGNAGHCRIVHNHIFDLNYTGISCGWTWGYAPTATVDNRIDYNHIHHINWDRVLSDNGGIYTLGTQPGTTLCGNHLHHIGRYGYGGWGIYPDEGSGEIIIEDNVVHHTDDAGFSTHYGRDNLVRNNIFALSGSAHLNPGKREAHRTTVFERNLVYWRGGALAARDWSPGAYLLHHNLLWAGGGPIECGGGMSLADWQESGQFLGCVVADPLFAAPEAGDFALRGDSPALTFGFAPLDPTKAGPRLRSQRAATFDDYPPPPAPAKPIVRTQMAWHDGVVRLTLRNVGQAPARGRLMLQAAPPEAVRFAERPTFAFEDLAPGAELSADFPAELQAADVPVTIETLPSGAGLVPALIYVATPRPEWATPRLPPLGGADDVAAALAAQSPRRLTHFRRVGAELRAAVAGPNLALHVRVFDTAIRQATPSWSGSCVELFVSRADARLPNANVSNPAVLRQVFLVPAVKGQPARATWQHEQREEPAPEVRLTSRHFIGGYELTALVPLAFLGLPADAGRFLLEAVVNTTLKTPTRAALFGAATPYCNNAGYGTITVV